MNQQKITLLADVISTQLTKGAIDQSYTRRINNKILKAEIKQYKRKLDIISLTIVGLALIGMITFAIFRLTNTIPVDNWLLVVLLPFLLLVSIVGLVNYFITHLQGMKALLKKEVSYESIEQQILTLTNKHDLNYNDLHRVYFSILSIETDYILQNFLAAIAVKNFELEEKPVFKERRMFHFLTLILTEQSIDYDWLNVSIGQQKKLFQQLNALLTKLEFLTNEMKAKQNLPQYFHDKIEKINHRIITYLHRADQQQKNLPEKLQDVLLLILRKIAKRKIDWLIVGSTALALYGLPIKGNDIDIVSTQKGIETITKLFTNEITQNIAYSETKDYRSYFGKMEIEGISIELMAELEYYLPKEKRWERSSALNNKRSVEFMGFLVPIHSLENELQFYQKKGRKKDQERIEIIQKELSSR